MTDLALLRQQRTGRFFRRIRAILSSCRASANVDTKMIKPSELHASCRIRRASVVDLNHMRPCRPDACTLD